MSNILIPILIILICNIFLFSQNNFIANKINLFDHPDNNRKIHLKKTAITGGVFIFINLIILFMILKIDFFQLSDVFFQSKRELVSFSLLISSSFIIGLYDDKYNLNPLSKLILYAFFILICLLIDENLIIKELIFYNFDHPIQLHNLAIPFTLLAVLLFINALNMFDGIDLQVSVYIFFLFIYFIFKFDNQFLILLLPVLIFVIYSNYKKKLFIGDSGSNILAVLISFLIIKEYNRSFAKLYCEEIFLLMLIPGIDMFRLFIIRIIKGKNPFQSDNQHLHHLYLNIFPQNYTIFIIQLHIFLPILIFNLFNSTIIIILIVSIIIYLINIFYFKLVLKN